MADILIRGMDMPKTCCECDLKFYDPEKRWDENGIEQIGAWVCKRTREIIWNTKRGDNCPLGPIPEGHGRLGDLDNLEELLRIMASYQTGERQHGILGCCETIRMANTIIPAEGGTDDV